MFATVRKLNLFIFKMEEIMTEEELKQMSIYELRNYGREMGIPCPAAQKKEELIRCILKINEEISPEQERNRAAVPEEKAKAETALMLTKEEMQTLSKFAFLGARVFNYYRKAQDIDIGYYELADKIYAHCYAAENGIGSAAEVQESERAGVCNRMEGELCGDITFFEKGVFKEQLAELLADRNYPLRPGEDPINHFNAEEIYSEKLEEQGLDFVEFAAPDIEEEVQARFLPDPTKA